MKAAVFDGKEITIKTISDPKIKDSQVLVHIKAVGICGTDLAIVNGDLPTVTPIILGHEFVGEVIKIGKNVDQSWLNKRVTSEINSNIDFDCYYCKQGLFTQCISRKAIGIDINGTFAEYIALESYLLHKIPDSIPDDDATFIEPLAAAYQTFEMMPLDQNDKIMAIFGLGKLGLLITQVALLRGLILITVDGSNKKLNLAKKFGAHHIINRLNCKDIPNKIKDLTNGLGADIIVDTTGNPDALREIIASCRTRGKIHIKSTHGIETPINLTDVVVRELTIYSSRCGSFEKAIEGIESGEVKVGELISNKFQLSDIKKAFKSYKLSRDHIKTIIQM
ncbi:MAG: alcohol dehydrogenase catalytic domain-containing protein [Candidatus Lokiarchaeota archaeon]|nr:alcohol dehydrogenase catalytic domain-containing protein [Candidatus Lokiarchaeota archaeon]